VTTRHVLLALVGATVVAGAVACGSSTEPGASSEAITTPPTPLASACTELGGKVGPDRVCAVHAEGDTYTIDMHFPADYPDQKALTDVLTKQRDQFVAAITEDEPPVNPWPKSLDITGTTYHSGTPDSGTESVVLEEHSDLGGAHGETEYESVNYDLAKKAPITFDTLFKPGSDPVAVLDPILLSEWRKLLDGIPIDDNLVGAEMYQAFALHDDAVVFYIGQGMWAFEAAGPQHFSIPRSELASILA
jgi:hypothetical protein